MQYVCVRRILVVTAERNYSWPRHVSSNWLALWVQEFLLGSELIQNGHKKQHSIKNTRWQLPLFIATGLQSAVNTEEIPVKYTEAKPDGHYTDFLMVSNAITTRARSSQASHK